MQGNYCHAVLKSLLLWKFVYFIGKKSEQYE